MKNEEIRMKNLGLAVRQLVACRRSLVQPPLREMKRDVGIGLGFEIYAKMALGLCLAER